MGRKKDGRPKTTPDLNWPIVGEYRHCEHGYDHPPWAHSCDGCFCGVAREKFG